MTEIDLRRGRDSIYGKRVLIVVQVLSTLTNNPEHFIIITKFPNHRDVAFNFFQD